MQLAPDCRETLEEDAVQVTHRFCHFSLSMYHMGTFSRDLCKVNIIFLQQLTHGARFDRQQCLDLPVELYCNLKTFLRI